VNCRSSRKGVNPGPTSAGSSSGEERKKGPSGSGCLAPARGVSSYMQLSSRSCKGWTSPLLVGDRWEERCRETP